jgi:septum formation protein
MRMRIILASASPRRLELLRMIGFKPEVRPSKVEEITASERPEEMVCELAEKKAQAVVETLVDETKQGTIIIGADTLVSLDGRALGKPRTKAEAIEMLHAYSNRTHLVWTGVSIWRLGKNPEHNTFSEKTKVHVYPMTDMEIERYVAENHPMDKAGAYGIQGPFSAFVSGIEGDYFNVVGLPIGHVYQAIKKLTEREMIS